MIKLFICWYFVMGTAHATELAQPVPPEFIRTQLIQSQGATPQQALQAAQQQALVLAQPPSTVRQPLQVTNWAVARVIRYRNYYQTDTWVTVRTAH